MYYLNHEHPLNIKALNDFADILSKSNYDQDAKFKFFQ